MQTANETTDRAVAGTQGAGAHAEPMNVRRRVGSTVYEVNIYFNQDAKETKDDKIMRLIRNEAGARATSDGRKAG